MKLSREVEYYAFIIEIINYILKSDKLHSVLPFKILTICYIKIDKN